MNYTQFHKNYNVIYDFLFRTNEIENTGYEWVYLENELYAIRQTGHSEFILVQGRSPQKALNNLLKIVSTPQNNVTNPKHYEGSQGLQAIEVHKNFMTDEQLQGYYLGNTLKYLLCFQNKNGLEDLKKARVHCRR